EAVRQRADAGGQQGLGPIPEDDPAPGEVVGADLHQYPVKKHDLDVVLPDLSADVREHFVPVVQLHPERGVAQALDDGALDLDAVCCPGHQRSTNSRLLLTRRAPRPSNSAIAGPLDSFTSAATVGIPRSCSEASVWASSARATP